MSDPSDAERRQESVDHVDPTDAGMMDPDERHQPATGVMGDETMVRMTGGGIPPYPGIDEEDDRRDDKDATPGPTDWEKGNVAGHS
ncbi:MAG: hypothetical protein ACR2OO_17585 [Thermomicrobiales bacterium]